MSFHDHMIEDGFRDEQAYMHHLMNKAQKRASRQTSSNPKNKGVTSSSNSRWLVDGEKFFDTFVFLTEDSENMLRDGENLMIEAPCIAKKKYQGNFIAFGLMFSSDANRIRNFVVEDRMIDYGAFVDSDIPYLTASNNEELGLIRTDDETFKSISVGDTVEVKFNLHSQELIARDVRGVVEEGGDDPWSPLQAV